MLFNRKPIKIFKTGSELYGLTPWDHQFGELSFVSYSSELSYGELQHLEFSRSCRQDLEFSTDLAGSIFNFQDPAGNTLDISRFLSFYNVTNFLKNFTRKLHAIFVWHEVHHYRKTLETTTVFAEKMDQGFSEVRISRIISLQCCMHRLFCLL